MTLLRVLGLTVALGSLVVPVAALAQNTPVAPVQNAPAPPAMQNVPAPVPGGYQGAPRQFAPGSGAYPTPGNAKNRYQHHGNRGYYLDSSIVDRYLDEPATSRRGHRKASRTHLSAPDLDVFYTISNK